MTIYYTDKSYCATVRNGKVEYTAEYADENGRIVYTETLTEREYNSRTDEA